MDAFEAPRDDNVDEFPIDAAHHSLGATAADWLESFRRHPEWTERERDKRFEAMVARFSETELLAAATSRVTDLTGFDVDPIIRILEAWGGGEDWAMLAAAVARQRDLPADRSWEILSVLDGFGLVESSPSLVERWHELNDEFETDDSIGRLVHQLEHDPDGLWLALEGLDSVEPKVRTEIITSLVADRAAGPGLIEFLRLLAFARDRPTRDAALSALERLPRDDPRVTSAWSSIAGAHDDRATARLAEAWVGTVDRSLPVPQGRDAYAASCTCSTAAASDSSRLVAEHSDHWVAAAFECDVTAGIRGVTGILAKDASTAELFLAEFVDDPARSVLQDAHDLAKGLLAGGLLLCGPSSSPALRFWLEGVAGRGFRPRPLSGLLPEPERRASSDGAAWAAAILDACPGCVDDSDLDL